MIAETKTSSSSKGDSLLSVRNLTIEYWTGGRTYFRAVDGISFDLNHGEILGLAGESGSGKSTIASAILRLIDPPSRVTGEIIFGNSNLLRLNTSQVRDYRWRLISMIFQGAMNSLDPVFTIKSQLVETIMAHDHVSKESALHTSLDLLHKVGIDAERAGDYPHQLSGGMRQRAMIAMALCLKPKLLIADEPTSALDVVTQRQIVELIRQLQREYDLSVLFITHDLPLLSGICDRMAIMHMGRIVEIGSHDEVLQTPKHPYTELLVKSTVSLNTSGRPYNPSLSKDETDSGTLENGCRFYPRCPIKVEKCRSIDPKLRGIKDGTHSVACIIRDGWNYDT